VDDFRLFGYRLTLEKLKSASRFVRWDYETKSIALTVFTGLTVSWVWHGLETHWKSFASWEQFFISWFIGVVILSVFVTAAVIFTHRFFLGSDFKDSYERLTFYIVMTLLVSAISVAVIANNAPSDLDFSEWW
jgi:hypothetical protein